MNKAKGARARYLPPQHGAWAFLGLPILLAWAVVEIDGPVLLLAAAWAIAYPWSYVVLSLIRTRRLTRYRGPMLFWSALLGLTAVPLLWLRPWLLWVGLLMGLLFAVNLYYSARKDERALLNDVVFVIECTLMVPVTWAVAVGGNGWTPPALATVPDRIWVLSAVCAMVLSGSVLHVKSLIRERGDLRYAWATRAFAIFSLLASIGLAGWWGLPSGWWLTLPFVALAIRGYVVALKAHKPIKIGMVELLAFVWTTICVWTAAP